jgi:hypothetical protein
MEGIFFGHCPQDEDGNRTHIVAGAFSDVDLLKFREQIYSGLEVHQTISSCIDENGCDASWFGFIELDRTQFF